MPAGPAPTTPTTRLFDILVCNDIPSKLQQAFNPWAEVHTQLHHSAGEDPAAEADRLKLMGLHITATAATLRDAVFPDFAPRADPATRLDNFLARTLPAHPLRTPHQPTNFAQHLPA